MILFQVSLSLSLLVKVCVYFRGPQKTNQTTIPTVDISGVLRLPPQHWIYLALLPSYTKLPKDKAANIMPVSLIRVESVAAQEIGINHLIAHSDGASLRARLYRC